MFEIREETICALMSLLTAPAVSWLWSHRKHPSEVTLVRPEDDEKEEAALWSGWSCQALYAEPPAPVSVHDELAGKSFEYIANKFQVSISDAQWILVGWNACRAAMLQGTDGNSPVIPDGWVACSERMPPLKTGVIVGKWMGRSWATKWATYIPSHPEANPYGYIMPGGSWSPTHWMPLPAAPKQEVKNG